MDHPYHVTRVYKLFSAYLAFTEVIYHFKALCKSGLARQEVQLVIVSMVERPKKRQKLAESSKSAQVEDNHVNQPKHTLYVNNLSDHINLKCLRTNLYLLFSIYGEVIKISVNPRRERGQAFVTMKNIDESNLAIISLNNELFFGKPLKVTYSKENTISV